MSILYSVQPITENDINQEFLDWLDGWGVLFPQQYVPGRYPKFSEVEAILNGLADCKISPYPTRGYPIQNIDISTERTATKFTIWQTKDDEIAHLGFRGGDYGFAQQVMQQFANICGMFLLTADGEDPVLVFPDQSSKLSFWPLVGGEE